MAQLSQVILTTDGACLGNPGPGGWAALLKHKTTEKLISGGEADTTNNRMELMAVIQGLTAITRRCKVHIVTDSKYVMDAFKQGWIEKWEANGWRNASKEPVKNQDLWEELVIQVDRHQVTWEWVKGHSGHVDNERVDAESQRMAKQMGSL